VPALCDLLASTMQFVALNFISGSVWQIIRGGFIVSTFFFSIRFLKMKPKPYQVAGSILAVLAVILVGFSAVLFSSSSDGGTDIVTLLSFRVFRFWVIFCLLLALFSTVYSSLSKRC